ncbi:hypothetical protein [Parathermosynechococcus lividus]
MHQSPIYVCYVCYDNAMALACQYKGSQFYAQQSPMEQWLDRLRYPYNYAGRLPQR